MVTDPISDFINQIKNAGMARKSEVTLSYSKMKHAIADLLVREGYIASVEQKGKDTRKTLKVTLITEEQGRPRINDVKRLSKPSRRMYAGVSEIRPVRGGVGIMVLSTPKGIMTDKQARNEKVGGELLFTMW